MSLTACIISNFQPNYQSVSWQRGTCDYSNFQPNYQSAVVHAVDSNLFIVGSGFTGNRMAASSQGEGAVVAALAFGERKALTLMDTTISGNGGSTVRALLLMVNPPISGAPLFWARVRARDGAMVRDEGGPDGETPSREHPAPCTLRPAPRGLTFREMIETRHHRATQRTGRSVPWAPSMLSSPTVL